MAAILDFQLKRFSLFLTYKSPQYVLLSFESTGLTVQELKSKIDFQDCGHLEFPVVAILAIFDIQDTR